MILKNSPTRNEIRWPRIEQYTKHRGTAMLHKNPAEMPITRILFALFLLLGNAMLTAQNSYQQFIPAANDVTIAGGTRVTWSLGDVFADDVTGSQTIIISRVREDLANRHGLRLLGNPTAAISRLELTEPIAISYQLYDLQGRLLLSKDAGHADRHDVNLGPFPAQIYLLSVFITDGKQLMATYRIQKR